MHEVVTVQLGNQANYLATHFWNAQESYFTYPTPTDPTPEPSVVDHDIHFRPGIGADGSDTYTPRTLIYDFQADFGGLRKLNALYETLRGDEVVKGLWDGIQQTHTIPPVEPIKYQTNLESGLPTPQLRTGDVRYWSDFNRLFYHPRSVLPISPQSFSSSLNAQESWANGVDLFKDVDREVDLLDRDIRPFVEEADSLSAFQVFSSVDDSWGGYATNYVEALREEYGKKGIWVWAIEDGRRVERMKQYQRLTNSARSLRSMALTASAYVRLSSIPSNLPEYIRLEPSSEWSTSALLSAAIESVTLPARLRSIGGVTATNLNFFEDALNTTGNQNVFTLKARARSLSTTPNGNGVAANNNTASQAEDSRIRQSHLNSSLDDNDDDHTLEPSTFDITFTPTLPTAQATFPSLSTTPTQSTTHVFAQVESHRYPSHLTHTARFPSRLTYQPPSFAPSSTIVTIHNTLLPYPLLTSYPATLFHLPPPTSPNYLLIDTALSTQSTTKSDILGLRELVAGRLGRSRGLIDSDEVEGLYDDLTRLGNAFDWGWEGSEDEDWGEGDD